MAKHITQKQRVLNYIKRHGSITRRQSFINLGVTELSSRIGEPESDGFKFNRERVTVKTRYGYKVSVTKYSLAR